MPKTRKKTPTELIFTSGRVLVGSCLDRLKELPDASVDSIVTDPPYELGFMGKSWDASGIAYQVELWRECLRMLKPGGHLLAFGGTRTYHRMAVAIEDAGFEVRDSIHWIYGSGFPKSLDVSKAIDKAAGAEREVVIGWTNKGMPPGSNKAVGHGEGSEPTPVTAPATDAARQWSGWGTALKPAHEPIVVARKPLEGTVAATVLKHGTGAINVDATRIGYASDKDKNSMAAGVEAIRERGGVIEGSWKNSSDLSGANPAHDAGRWPSNIVFTHAADCDTDCVPGCPVAELDQQQDGASRFFTVTEWSELDAPFRYVAKPGKKERNAGLDGLPERVTNEASPPGTAGARSRRAGANRNGASTNHHPTVKPVAIMRWLVRLVTPPDGTVLDPFLGSGTTAVAAIAEGFQWVGCEMTADYLPIIEGRVKHAEKQKASEPPSLFPA